MVKSKTNLMKIQKKSIFASLALNDLIQNTLNLSEIVKKANKKYLK